MTKDSKNPKTLEEKSYLLRWALRGFSDDPRVSENNATGGKAMSELEIEEKFPGLLKEFTEKSWAEIAVSGERFSGAGRSQ